MTGNCDFTMSPWWGGWMGHTSWIILLVLACVVAAWCMFQNKKGGNPVADRVDSLEILKLRLARGEITIEEYTALKGAL